MQIFLLWILTLYSTCLFSTSQQHIQVDGWHISHPGTFPNRFFGNDPVMGRLTCPPITRLNLKKQLSQDLIVSSTTIDSEKQWTYTLRKGIFWWDGKEVSPVDLQNYLDQNLPSTPSFQANVQGHQVIIHWSQPPGFGPYILNGLPFYKTDKDHNSGFQCVGNYKPATKNWDILLPNSAYRIPRPTLEFTKFKKNADISFKYSKDKRIAPEDFQNPQVCKNKVPLHAATILKWNLQSSVVTDTKVRNLLSQAIPRQTLATFGSSTLADAQQSFISKNHPFASRENSQLSLQEIANQLDQLGYKRNHPDHPRLTPNQIPMSLSVSTSSHNIMTKVLMDNFQALGVDVHFDERNRDLEIMSVWLPWPELNFSEFSSSLNMNTKLKLDFQNYARSLSDLKPNFQLLKSIDQQLMTDGSLSVILIHQACLELKDSFHYGGGHLDFLDPDWFRDMIELAYRKG